MVTLTTCIMFLLFTCTQVWVWGILLSWPACASTACEVVRDSRKFEKRWLRQSMFPYLLPVQPP
jgi:hypothetical protein